MSFARDVDRFMARRDAAARERLTDRDRFLRDLADDVLYQLGSAVEATAEELRTALGLALDGASVRRDTTMRYGVPYGGIGTGNDEPSWSSEADRDHPLAREEHADDVEGYRFTVTTRPREFGPEEAAQRAQERARGEERAARRREEQLWTVGDHAASPPPDSIDLYRLIDSQATWWRPRVEGRLTWCRIVDLTPARRIGVLGFLIHSLAEDYKAKDDYAFLRMATGPMGPRGEMAQDAVEHEMAVQFDTGAEEFMRRQPLVRALVKLAKLDRLRGLRIPGCSLDDDIRWTWEGFAAHREAERERLADEWSPDHD